MACSPTRMSLMTVVLGVAAALVGGCTLSNLANIPRMPGVSSSQESAPPPLSYRALGAQDWAQLKGVWLGNAGVGVGPRRYPADLVLSFSPDRSAMEITFPGGAIARTRLRPVGALDDAFVFEGVHPEFQNMSAKQRQQMPVGRVVLRPRPDGTYEGDLMVLEDTSDGYTPDTDTPDEVRSSLSSSFRARAPVSASSGRTRDYGSLDPHLYQDWRSRSVSSAYVLTDHKPSDIVGRIRNDIVELQQNEWRCVNQIERTVRPGQVNTYNFDAGPFSSRAFLIHSSVPQVRLAWSASRSPSAYISAFTSSYYHPIVLAERGYDTKFTLRIVPAPGAIDPPDASTVVTILEFTNNPFDTSPLCDLDRFGVEAQRSLGHHLKLLGTALVALGLEDMRREAIENDNVIAQILAEHWRNRAVESALRQVAPEASDAEINYFMSWVGVLTSKDILSIPLGRESAKDWLVRYIRQHAPEYANSKSLIDMLVDVHLEVAAAIAGSKR